MEEEVIDCRIFLEMISGGFASSMEGVNKDGGKRAVRWVVDELNNWARLGEHVLEKGWPNDDDWKRAA